MLKIFFDFLHNFRPQPIILRLGFLNIHWYSSLIVLAMVLGLILVFRLATRRGMEREKLENLIFYLIIISFVGARLYHIFSEFPYYLKNPLAVFKVWEGGLGIYGAIVAGLLFLLWFCRKYKMDFFSLVDILAPALILGQAIGRWGNYFNQEVFGLPTDLPWGIFIDVGRRPAEFFSYSHFHPTFLYESVWNLFVFLLLLLIIKKRFPAGKVFASYLISYSFGRFCLEFLRTDSQPTLFGLRLAQIVSILMFVAGWVMLIKKRKSKI